MDVATVRLDAALEVDRDVLALFRPFDEYAQVVRLLAQGLGKRAVVFDALAALQDLLRVGLVFPEVGRGDAGLEIGKLALETGFVKAPS